jgi:hypothetical protein
MKESAELYQQIFGLSLDSQRGRARPNNSISSRKDAKAQRKELSFLLYSNCSVLGCKLRGGEHRKLAFTIQRPE